MASIEPVHHPGPEEAAAPPSLVFRGCVVRTPEFGRLELDIEATIVVGQHGTIIAYFPSSEASGESATAFVDAASAAGTLRLLGG